jgi:hypothetical protein
MRISERTFVIPAKAGIHVSRHPDSVRGRTRRGLQPALERRRWLAAGLLLATGACGSKPADPFGAADADRIECRVGTAADFDRACVVERTSGPEGLVLTIRHPDGGFRRLLVTTDGRGVVAADGAEPATVSVEGGDGIVVAVGGDTYRLPATVKPSAP